MSFLTSILISLAMATAAVAPPRARSDGKGSTLQAEFIRQSDRDQAFLKNGQRMVMRLAQHIQNDPQERSEPTSTQQPTGTGNDSPAQGTSPPPTPSDSENSGETPAFQAPVPLQAQKWLVLAIVVGGLIGVVTVIVFAATTIASASSVAKQREYR